MNNKLSKFFCILLAGICLIGCRENSTVETDCPKYDYTDSATPIPDLPQYLSRVWPTPHSIMTLPCYNESTNQEFPGDGRGVGVGIIVDKIDTKLLATPEVDLTSRVALYLDDDLVQTDITSFGCGLELISFDEKAPTPTHTGRSACYSMSWNPNLSSGDHLAKIVIERDDGSLLDYTWEFTILD